MGVYKGFLIIKKKSPYYYYRIKIKNEFGKWISIEVSTSVNVYTGKNKREKSVAEEQAYSIGEQLIKKKLNTKISDNVGRIDRSRYTFKEYSEYYLENCHLDTATIRNYRETLEKHIYPTIGHIKICDLTQFHLNQYIENKIKECIELQKNIDRKKAVALENNECVTIQTFERPCTYSIRKHRDIIRLILSKALNNGDVEKNVAKMIDRNILDNLPTKDTELAPYTKKEIETLLAYVKGTKMEVPIVLASALGLRREEVLGLKFKDVDWLNSRIHINDTVIKVNGVSSAIYKKRTKTQSSKRHYYLSNELREYLLLVREEQDKLRRILGDDYDNHTITYEDDFKQIKEIDYISNNLDFICRDELGQVLKPNYISQSFNNILKKNNLRPTRFHDLRHSVGTIILETTHDMKLAQTTLGHSNIGTTMNIYAGAVSDDYIRQGTDIMSNVVENVVASRKSDI